MIPINYLSTRNIFNLLYSKQGFSPEEVECLINIRIAEMVDLNSGRVGTEEYYNDRYFNNLIPKGNFSSGTERTLFLLAKVRRFEENYFKKLGFVDNDTIQLLRKIHFLMLLKPPIQENFEFHLNYLCKVEPTNQDDQALQIGVILSLVEQIKMQDKSFYQTILNNNEDAQFLTEISIGLMRIHFDPTKENYEKFISEDNDDNNDDNSENDDKTEKESHVLRAIRLVPKIAPAESAFLKQIFVLMAEENTKSKSDTSHWSSITTATSAAASTWALSAYATALLPPLHPVSSHSASNPPSLTSMVQPTFTKIEIMPPKVGQQSVISLAPMEAPNPIEGSYHSSLSSSYPSLAPPSLISSATSSPMGGNTPLGGRSPSCSTAASTASTTPSAATPSSVTSLPLSSICSPPSATATPPSAATDFMASPFPSSFMALPASTASLPNSSGTNESGEQNAVTDNTANTSDVTYAALFEMFDALKSERKNNKNKLQQQPQSSRKSPVMSSNFTDKLTCLPITSLASGSTDGADLDKNIETVFPEAEERELAKSLVPTLLVKEKISSEMTTLRRKVRFLQNRLKTLQAHGLHCETTINDKLSKAGYKTLPLHFSEAAGMNKPLGNYPLSVVTTPTAAATTTVVPTAPKMVPADSKSALDM